MKAKYIDKTFPITLQDLIDLVKSDNRDPKDLRLIMNSNCADLSAYVQCALLNQDQGHPCIELYTDANDGFHLDLKKKYNFLVNLLTEDQLHDFETFCKKNNL